METMKLSDHPQIVDLYMILEQNGLAKLRRFLESCGKAFDHMERGADNLIGKIQSGRTPDEKKQSVKSELRQLKTGNSKRAKAPISKEQAR